MDGQVTRTVAQDRDRPAAPRRSDLWLVGLLLLAAVALRAWHLTHTEVAARDSIGFIRYAWQLGHHSWVDTIRNPAQGQHPGYPAAILAMSYPVRLLRPAPETQVMQLSAQLISCLASVLLVVPMFYLGRDLFHRGVGFWAALVFQTLPAAGRVFADGLSEGLFLLLTATALLGAVRAFRAHSPAWFALTGVFGALAYLTRPEGALVVAATGLVLLGVQCVRARRVAWRRLLACGTALAVTAAVIGSPVYLITGQLTAKPTARRLIDSAVSPDLEASPRLPPGEPLTPGPSPRTKQANRVSASILPSPPGGEGSGVRGFGLPPSPPTPRPPGERGDVRPKSGQVPGGARGDSWPAFPFAVWLPEGGDPTTSWGLGAVGQEFLKGSHYVLWLPMLLGLWWFRDRFRLLPGAWVLLMVGLAVLGLMWRVASLLGYVSDRHLLLPMLCGTYWGVAMVPPLVRAFAALAGRLRVAVRLGAHLPAAASPVWGTLLLAGFVGTALPKTLEPLHANRKGFRDAGLWIAEHSRPWDAVMDPYSWSHYYSGKVFLEDESPAPPAGQTKVCYVVIEASGREHVRLRQIQTAMECAAHGRLVWEKPSRRRKDVVNVMVYEAPASSGY